MFPTLPPSHHSQIGLRFWQLILIMLLAAPQCVLAQRTLTGTVRDRSGEALPGVTLRVTELRGVGTTTDAQGHFSLTVRDLPCYTLQISMVGMQTQHIAITPLTSSPLAITLREEARTMETLVVTATRTPKTLLDVPVPTRVLDAADIAASDASTVQDLLQTELPGVEFSYSMNQQVNLNLQGFGGNSILFLVDGERLAGETLDNVDYSRLNLSDVGRVEIVKGAASSLYGSNAVGGVVNLIPRTATEPWTLKLNARYGSYGDLRYGATASVNRKNINSTTTVQLSQCDSVHLSDDPSSSLRAIYGFRTLNASERLIYTPVERLKITGRAGYFFRERESAATLHDRYRDFSGGLRGEYAFTDCTDLMLSYAFDQYDKSDYALGLKRDVRDYSNVQHTVRTLFNHSLDAPSSPTLTLGGDLMRDYLMSYQFGDDGYHLQYTADAFAQWDQTFSDQWNLIAALRYDYYSEMHSGHLSPKLNIMYRLPHWSFRAGYANGFRAPSLKEMYMNFDMANIFMIYGNKDLKPEVSNNFNLNAEYTEGPYNLTAMAYFNHVQDRITTLWNQARNGMVYENMSRMNIYGIDLGLCCRWDNGIGCRIAYIYTHEGISSDGLRSSTRPHTATLRVDYSRDWHWGITTLAVNGRALSAVTCDEITNLTDPSQHQEVTYPGYMLWRIMLTHQFSHGIILTATIDNLFNYQPKIYYNNSPATAGRTFGIGLTWDVDKLRK